MTLARGTPVAGVTGGAVVPPGRYWLDTFGDNRAAFSAWAKSKPEVKVEGTQDFDSDPPRMFAIFVIPSTASNFGLPGVWFPTVKFGFPEVAPASVQSSDDTVQKPTVVDPLNTLADAAAGLSPMNLAVGAGVAVVAIVLLNALKR